MSKLVTIYGGSGFVGRQIAFMMAQRGWRVRIAVRRPDEALFARTYGAVGQVVPVFCNVRDPASVRLAMESADAVVNCVNLTEKQGKSTLENVLVDGAANIARISAELGVKRVVHLSGIGADAESDNPYIAAKGRGEAAVLEHRPDAVILRPSVIFGPGDTFYNRLAGLSRMGPIMPIIGAKTRLQPVYVDDVALAGAKAITGEIGPAVYELGGPEVMTTREVVHQTLKAVDRRRAVIGLPFWLARIPATLLGFAQWITGGLFTNNILSRDHIALMRHDNVVADDALGFAEIGIEPTASGAVIDEYLWRFRPGGQYDAIKESARYLRSH